MSNGEKSRGGAHIGIPTHDRLPCLVHTQRPHRKRKRRSPEHRRNRCRRKHLLQTASVQVDHRDKRRADHAHGDKEVLARSPEGIGLQQRDAAVPDGEEVAVLKEYHRYIAAFVGSR